MGFAEPRVARAQAGLRVGQRREQDGIIQHRARRDVPADDEIVNPSTRVQAHGAGLGVPSVAQPLRRQGLVLALSGAQRRAVVGPHSLAPGRERELPLGFEMGLDRDRPLREPRSCSRVKPTISRQPLRSGPHATPSRRARSRSSSLRNTVPVAFAQVCNGFASNATKAPSWRRTTFGIKQCVCSCGSPARDVRCANVATANPSVTTRRRNPPSCLRATASFLEKLQCSLGRLNHGDRHHR